MSDLLNDMNVAEFRSFHKIPRLFRDVIITEKIDGTNACVVVTPDGTVLAQSRSRFITPEDDNFGFAAWVQANAAELAKMGVGHHFGEWWGAGIQRKYGLTEKRFSLFHTARILEKPVCVGVVPTLYEGTFHTGLVEWVLQELKENGSVAAPGFMKPEGIVLYHTGSRAVYKATIEDDSIPKSKVVH